MRPKIGAPGGPGNSISVTGPASRATRSSAAAVRMIHCCCALRAPSLPATVWKRITSASIGASWSYELFTFCPEAHESVASATNTAGNSLNTDAQLPDSRLDLARLGHFMTQLLGVALDVRHGWPVVEQNVQLFSRRQFSQRVSGLRPGQGTQEPAQVEPAQVAISSSYCCAESRSAISAGCDSSISTIQPFSCGSSLTPSGASTSAWFTLVTLPVTGANSSLTALVLSTTPKGWPRVTVAPTSGISM